MELDLQENKVVVKPGTLGVEKRSKMINFILKTGMVKTESAANAMLLAFAIVFFIAAALILKNVLAPNTPISEFPMDDMMMGF